MAKISDIIVEKEFRDLLDAPDDAEKKALRAKMKVEGQTDDLIVWAETGILVDGHTRFDIAKSLGWDEVKTEHREFGPDTPENRAVIKNWICQHAVARRNLNPRRRAYFLGQRYEAEKGTPGKKAGGPTAERLAKEEGVSQAKVKRAARFKAVVDKLEPEHKEAVLSGKARPPKLAPPPKKASRKPVGRFAWGREEKETAKAFRVFHRIADAYPEKLTDAEKMSSVSAGRSAMEWFLKLKKKLAK